MLATPAAAKQPAGKNERTEATLTPEEERKHDDLFKRGADLVAPYMRLTDRPAKEATESSRDLRDGIRLLDEALKIFPGNWAALWIQGKGFQALRDHQQAYERFKRSYRLQRDNPDVGRELMLECLEVGRAGEAVDVARAISAKSPRDAGLRANLALALLLAGRLQEADDVVKGALKLDASDAITKDLAKVIAEVRDGKRPRPRHISDLQQ